MRELVLVLVLVLCSSPVHGGKCHHGGTKNGKICVCAAGWTGATCQTPVAPPPAPPPCLHGGTATDGGCRCAAGWMGDTCDDVDHCATTVDPCGHGGTCQNGGTTGYTCACKTGWTGPRCDESDACSSNPCRNGGTCEGIVRRGTDPQFQCTCPSSLPAASTSNPVCEDTDACESSPCGEHGVCAGGTLDGRPHFTCTCNAGWDGPACDQNDQDACSTGPCGRHGECIVTSDRKVGQPAYHCRCADDWTGNACQVPPQVCNSSPCANCGACAQPEHEDSYTCTCTAGYTGDNCATPDDQSECANDECFRDENHFSCASWGTRVRTGIAADGWDCWADDAQARSWGYTSAASLAPVREHCPLACGLCGSPCEHVGDDGHMRPWRDPDNVTYGRWEFSPDHSNATLVCPDPLCVAVGEGRVQTCGRNGWSGQGTAPRCEKLCSELEEPLHGRPGGAWNYTDPRPQPGSRLFSPGTVAQLFCDQTRGFTPVEQVQRQVCSDDNGLWTGGPPACEVDKNHACLSSPCQNGGTCLGHERCLDGHCESIFECTCTEGWGGDTCAQPPDPCISNPCSGDNGKCSPSNGAGFECRCNSGWMGDRCEQPSSCASNPCQNGGQCVDRDGIHHTCQCRGTYYGGSCEHQSLCTSHAGSCLNRGVCLDCDYLKYLKDHVDNGTKLCFDDNGQHESECRCPYEYGGDKCEVAPKCDDASKCKHGGTCTNIWDDPPDFNCTCLDPYKGRICEQCDANIAVCAKDVAVEHPETVGVGGVVLVVLIAFMLLGCCQNKDKIQDATEQYFSSALFGEAGRPEFELATLDVDARWHQARSAVSPCSEHGDFENPTASAGGRPATVSHGRRLKQSSAALGGGAPHMFRDVHVAELRPSSWREQVIGKGSYGQVYRATWRGQQVAVKQLRMPEQPHPGAPRQAFESFAEKLQEVRDDFVKEIEICCDLDHPNLVALLGYSTRPPKGGAEEWLIVQELLAGQSLDAHLYTNKWAPTAHAVRKIAQDVARGMHYLHEGTQFELPIIHRDLKSPNLLLVADPPPPGEERTLRVKIADFGLSTEKAVDEEATETMLMTGCGSILWMAPEILLGERYNEKVDVFSYAMCLVELVDCNLPWHNCARAHEVAVQVTRGKRPDKQLEHADSRMKDLIEQCWAPASQRLSFAEVLERLGPPIR